MSVEGGGGESVEVGLSRKEGLAILDCTTTSYGAECRRGGGGGGEDQFLSYL